MLESFPVTDSDFTVDMGIFVIWFGGLNSYGVGYHLLHIILLPGWLVGWLVLKIFLGYILFLINFYPF